MKRRASGFTLIELLASVTILMVIVWLMARIFTESDRAWNLGTGRAENCMEGRAALQMLQNDLQYAVADDILSFHMGEDRDSSVTPYGSTSSDEICFVSIQHDSSSDDPDANRAAREMHYYLKKTEGTDTRYQLQRGYFSGEIINDAAMHCYGNTNWWKSVSEGGSGRPSASQVIAENIVRLSFYSLETQDQEYNSIEWTNRLPQYVDVLLEVLSDRDAEQVEQMEAAGVDASAFLEQSLRRYSTRIHFQNRHGYLKRVGS